MLYLTRVAVPSLITFYATKNMPNDDFKNRLYYSMPWERTADWFGGVNRTFIIKGSKESYKSGSVGWSFAELILGWRVIPFYFLFGY